MYYTVTITKIDTLDYFNNIAEYLRGTMGLKKSRQRHTVCGMYDQK